MGLLSCFTSADGKSSAPRRPTINLNDATVYSKTINGHKIAFTDFGFMSDNPVIVTFSGWNQDHRGWINVTPYLLDNFRVISVCFRGHGPDRDPVDNFGFKDHARDVLGILDSLGVEKFICMAASHGTWAAMELAEIVSRRRCLAILVLDLIMTEAPAQFIKGLQALQGKDTWRPAVIAFFKGWNQGSRSANLREQMLLNSGGFNYETWSRAGRTIEEAYNTWGSPLGRMEQLTDPPLIHHIYTQPAANAEEYELVHKRFQQLHSDWFSFFRARGHTHTPHIEQPQTVNRELRALVIRALARSYGEKSR